MKKKKYIIGAIVIVVIGGFFYWKSRTKTSEGNVEYVTATVEKGILTSSVSATGSVFVDNDATVDPTISGTVADLSVKVGDTVEEGQFLFNIINNDLDVSVSKSSTTYQQAVNAVASARVDKDNAKAEYEAAKKKDKKDGSSYTSEQLAVLKDRVDLKRDAITQAERELSSAGLSLRNERENAAKRKVTAPISGTVNEINIKNGEDLGKTSSSSSNESPIIIGDLNTLKVSVSVNEVDIAKVTTGQKVMMTLDALESMTISGKVEKIDSLGTTDQGVVSYNVTISFDALDERIKPQMSVSASIITEVKQDALIVPNSAVKNEGTATYVEVLEKQIPQRKTVVVGISNDSQTEIINGVSEGLEVITQTIDSAAATTKSSSSGSSSSRGQGGLGIPIMGGR